jgi:hypothetical protein
MKLTVWDDVPLFTAANSTIAAVAPNEEVPEKACEVVPVPVILLEVVPLRVLTLDPGG